MKKIVLTGGSCSGKSTIINKFNSNGHKTLVEVARHVLEERKNFPLSKDELSWRQKVIYQRQLELENYHDQFYKNGEVLIQDRSLVDVLAYCKLFGIDEIKYFNVERLELDKRYDSVLFLERLPFKSDGLRIENDESADMIGKEIENTYRNFGYEIVKVPVMILEERYRF